MLRWLFKYFKYSELTQSGTRIVPDLDLLYINKFSKTFLAMPYSHFFGHFVTYIFVIFRVSEPLLKCA